MFWTLEIPFKTGFTVRAYECHENVVAETKPTFYSPFCVCVCICVFHGSDIVCVP
jgi:hypothetical protein